MDALTVALGAAGLIGFLIVLAKKYITSVILKSVDHGYKKLEESHKAQLRKSEESFKSRLRANELEITALRGGMLAAVSSRQLLLDKKRLESVEEVWAAVNALAPYKFVSSWMSGFKFDELAEAAITNPNYRKLVDVLDKQIDPESIKAQVMPCNARPFVTPLLWASYTAYSSVLMHAVVQAHAIKHGVGSKVITDKGCSEILKVALPHQAAYIDKFGASGYHHLLEELEQMIIYEIHQTISGADTDQAGINQAAAVLKKCDEVVANHESSRFQSSDG